MPTEIPSQLPFVSVVMKFLRDTPKYKRFEAIGGQGEPIGNVYIRKEAVPKGTEIVRVDVSIEG